MNNLQEFVKEVEETHGAGSAMMFDQDRIVEVDVIPTGVQSIDTAIGTGGIPRGRITEVFGKEGSGKTSLCLHTIATAHKMGMQAGFIDAEHALDKKRMDMIGVQSDKLVISQPDSGEQALEIAEMMIRSKRFGIIVIDSVAALTPQVEIERDMGESSMGIHARLMSQAMRKLVAIISKNNVAVIFTNQTRSKIGFFGGETTTGGNALKFYASLRLKFQYTGAIKNTAGQRISGKYRMTVVKNKMAVPFKEVEFEINEYGIDTTAQLIQTMLDEGKLEKSGAFYKVNGKVIAQGNNALKELIRSGEFRIDTEKIETDSVPLESNK